MNRKLLVVSAVALLVFANEGKAPAASYTITVDASKQTAGNPRFWAASVGTGTASLTLRADLQTHYKLANREIGAQRVRGHGVLNDDMGIFHWAGGTAAPTYNWTNFDKYLTAIVSAGMRPIMELSFMPKDLATDGNSRSKPKDMTVYRQFIQAVVQHCVDKYGAADVAQWYWEVWNEPDYAGFWNGTISDYYALYDAAVDGATAVLPNIQIGGPATTEPGKIGAFLQHCKSANKRVTFVSSHAYPGGNGGTSANATSLVNDNNTRISQISSGGYTTATVKSFNTEWNSAYSGQGGNPGDANESMDSHANAPFILKSVKLLSDKNQGETPPLEVFSYWVVSDVFDESSGPSGSYILSKGGNLPFGQVFGLMTFQGVRKAAFNAFKMLNYLGPKRLMSAGGTGSDGVDAMATLSASGDEVQILVYNYYAALKSSGSDNVTVTVSNLPAALAGKEAFTTHFRVDESHSNPYSVWLSQGKPTNPTEAQWQALRQAQHLALLQPVSKAAVTTSYTATFELPRQAASLVILGVKRPVVGRNALVEIEGEDYDGQSGVTKEDSNDATLGQSIAGSSGSFVYFDNVDFGDAGVSAVQLRVAAQGNTTLELHADAQTGPLLGTCALTATSAAWATQTCNLAAMSGVHRLVAVFGGAARVNWLKFQAGGGGTGAGGAGGSTGAGGTTGAGGVTGAAGTTGRAGAGGGTNTGAGGSGGSGSGATTGNAGSAGPGLAGAGGSGSATGDAGTSGSGVGGSGIGGAASGTTGTAGSGGSPPGGGAAAPAGCACDAAGAGGPSAGFSAAGLLSLALALRKRRARRSPLGLALVALGCSDPPANDVKRTICADPTQVACGQHCFDLSSDPTNCGGCGIPCSTGQTCQAGACRCDLGLVDCNGTCVAPDTCAGASATLDLVTSTAGAYWNTSGEVTEVTSGDADVTVDDTATAQTWEGFGGAFNERGWYYLSLLDPSDRDAALHLLYGADGARFAFGRIPIGASDYAMDRYTLDETAGDTTLDGFSIDRDRDKLIPYIKAAQAVKANIRFWASPWTPPTWMKQGPFQTGSMGGSFDGGTMKSDDATMAAFARYLIRFVQAYGQEGIPIEAISAQNEPSYTGSYPTCGWSAATYTTFVGRHLGPAVAEAGLATKLVLGTFNGGGSDPAILAGVMADDAARSQIGILGFQWGMQARVAGAKAYDLPIWQTEHQAGNYPWAKPFNPTTAPNDHAFAVESWRLIRDWIRAGATAYSAWNMVLDTAGVGIDSSRIWPQNALLTVDIPTRKLSITPTYQVFRHFSRFVAVGAKVVATRGGDAVAFRNPDGSVVTVAYNGGAEKPLTVTAAGRKLRFLMPADGWATVVAR